MDGSSRQPQISELFSRFALSFKSKAAEFFSEEDNSTSAAVENDHPDTAFTLLNSTEDDFIPEQKVVVIKPDSPPSQLASPPRPPPPSSNFRRSSDFQFNETLISSLFATLSSFEASYLQLQTAHVPFDEEAIKSADKALVSHLQTLSEFKQLYKNYYHNPDFCVEFSTGSCLEFQVNENQSKLRALKSVFNRLQSEIDVKDEEVSRLRKHLGELERQNSNMSSKLECGSNSMGKRVDILLSVQVFVALLRDTCRLARNFTKLLSHLMEKAGWDLELAANSVYPGIKYAKKGHNRYALLSYICLRMFQGFDSEDFGLTSNGEGSPCDRRSSLSYCEENSSANSLKQLIEHVSCDPLELLRKSPNCRFSWFCECKYQQLIHPTMESSIFSELDQEGEVVNSWKSLEMFHDLFVKLASSIWILQKLAFSFDPPVRVFQVDRNVNYSVVFMEDVTGKCKLRCQRRPKVGFTVIPGFKIGQTIVQSKVYLL